MEPHEDPDYISKFLIHQDTLQYKGRLVLSRNSKLIPAILHLYHDHSSFLHMYKRLQGELYWEIMKGDVKKYMEQCTVCQKKKIESMSPAGLLQTLQIRSRINEFGTIYQWISLKDFHNRKKLSPY